MLQAGCERWRGLVLLFCIRPVNRAFMALAIMDIRTHPISFSKALRGRLGHQITGASARPFVHLLNPTRRPRQSVKRYRLLKRLLISRCIYYDARFIVAP